MKGRNLCEKAGQNHIADNHGNHIHSIDGIPGLGENA
jgi:hypothetical protein